MGLFDFLKSVFTSDGGGNSAPSTTQNQQAPRQNVYGPNRQPSTPAPVNNNPYVAQRLLQQQQAPRVGGPVQANRLTANSFLNEARNYKAKEKKEKEKKPEESNPYKMQFGTEDYRQMQDDQLKMAQDPRYNALMENIDYKDIWNDDDKKYFEEHEKEMLEHGILTTIAKGDAGSQKKLEDATKDYGFKPQDAIEIDKDGNAKWIDFEPGLKQLNSEIEELEKQDRELDNILNSFLSSMNANPEGLAEYNETKQQSDLIKNRLDELNEQKNLISAKKNYQTALSERSYYEYLRENGTKDDFQEYAKYTGSYLNNTLEDIGLNVMASNYRKASGLAMLVENVRQSYGDSEAKKVNETADKLLENKVITVDEYNELRKYAQEIVNKNTTLPEDSIGLQLNDIANQLAQMQVNGEGTAEKLFVNVVGNVIDNMGSQFLPAMAFGRAGMMANTALMSLGEYTSVYQQDIALGYTHEQSMNDAMLQSGVEFLTELIGGERLLRFADGDIVPRSLAELAKEGVKSGVAESLEEGIGWGASPLAHALATGEMPSIESWNPDELKEAVVTAFLAGFLQTGVATDYTQFGTEAPLSSTERLLTDFLKISTREGKNRVRDFITELDNMTPGSSIRKNITMPDGTKISERDYIGLVKKIAQKQINEYESKIQVKGVEILDNRTNPIQSLAEDSRYALDEVLDVQRMEKIKSLEQSLEAGNLIQMANENMTESLQNKLLTQESERLAKIQEELKKDNINADPVMWDKLSNEAKANATIVSKVTDAIGSLPVEFADLRTKDGKIIDGFYKDGRIVVNPNAKLGAISTFIHEYTHGKEASGFYDALKNEVKRYYGKDYRKMVDSVIKNYSDLQELSREDAEKELVAITVQDMIGDAKFIKRLVKYHTDMAYRMYTDLKSMTTLTDVGEEIAQTFMQAFNENLDKVGINLDAELVLEEVGDSSEYYEKDLPLTMADVAKRAIENINRTFDNSERVAVVDSNGAKIKCTTEGLKHGILDIKSPGGRASAFVVEHADIAIKNAHKIEEELLTKKHPKGQDVYLSIVYDTDGNAYPTRIIVDKDTSVLTDMSIIDRLYGSKSFKKEVASLKGPFVKNGTTSSNTTLYDLAVLVKNSFPDTLPQIVLDGLGIERPDTALGKNAMFSEGLTPEQVKQDANYMKAVRNGDMETAEKMVRARAEDYAKRTGQYMFDTYHGTNARFNRFDSGKLGSKNFMAQSAYMGFFSSGSRKTAEAYTGLNDGDMLRLALAGNSDEKLNRIIKEVNDKYGLEELEKREKEGEDAYYQNAINEARRNGDPDLAVLDRLEDPEVLAKLNMSEEEIKKLVDTMTDTTLYRWNARKNPGEEYDNLNRITHEYHQTDGYKEIEAVKTKANEEYNKRLLEYFGYEPNVKHMFAFMKDPLFHDFHSEKRDEAFSSLLDKAIKNGNDGAVFENVQDGSEEYDTIYVVFDPAQYKSADPVTYDDDGNVIPLSKRFDQNTDDLRYSKSLTPEDLKNDPKVQRYYATIAPYYDTRLNETNRERLINLAEKAYDGMAKEIADKLGIKPSPKRENIGGFENDDGKKLREVSWTYDLGEIDSDKAKLFTSLMGDLAFENQEAVICMRYLDESEGKHPVGEIGSDGGTYGKEFGFQYKDLETVTNALQKADIANYNIDRETNYLTVQDFGFDGSLPEKLDVLLEGDNYETKEVRPIYSYYLQRKARQSLYETRRNAESNIREGNESDLPGLVEEANKRVKDVIDKKASGQESPFLRRPEVTALDDGDLNISEKDLKNYKTVTPYTDHTHRAKNVDTETGVFKPEGIVDLETTIGKTTHQEEIDDAEKYAGDFATRLDAGQDVEKLIQELKDKPLDNGLVRAYYVAQVLADRGMTDEYMDLAQWARDIDNLGGKLIESTKILYNLKDTFSRAVYISKVEQNMIDEYKAKGGKNKDIDEIIHNVFDKYGQEVINSKTVLEFRKKLGQMVREANRLLPKTIWDRIVQYRMWAMLSGPKTAIGNALSNLTSLGLYRMNSVNQAILESALKEVTIKNIDTSKSYKINQEDRNATLNRNKAKTKANKEIANEVWQDLKSEIKSKYDTGAEVVPEIIKKNLKIDRKSPARKFADKVFETAQGIETAMLNDAPYAKLAFVSKFNEMAQARGLDLKTLDRNSDTFNKLVNDAYKYAEEVVSHDDTAISKTIANITKRSASNVRINEDSYLVGLDKQIKNFKEKANQGELMYKLADKAVQKAQQWFVPFYKTNASLLKKSLQYSPLEWAQVANDYSKVKAGKMELVDMVEHMAKAVTGSELYILGAIFARLGWLKWEKDDEDYSGRLAVKVPGTKYGYTVDFLDPISTIFAKGVALDQELQENGVSFDTLENLWHDYEEIFLSDELDMFSSLKDFFDTIKKADEGTDDYGNEYTLGDGATDTMFTVFNSYIPAIVRDLSRLAYPEKKTVYDTDNKKYLLNRLINSTPFRNILKDKKDAVGNSLTYTQPFTKNDPLNRALTFISKGKLVDMEGKAVNSVKENPESVLGEKSTEFTQMAQDFQFKDENGDGFSDVHWIRETVPSNIYPNDIKTELNPEEKDTYGKTWTDTWTAGANYLLNNEEYKKLDYENQADIIYELQGFARECIEADYCRDHKMPMTVAQQKSDAIRKFCTKNGKIDGETLGLIALGNAKENKLANGGQRYVVAVQDENGKTITNSRQLYMRQLYEKNGVYEDILKLIKDSNGLLEYADFGLGKTVVEKYSAETARDKYLEIYGGVMSKDKEKSSGKKKSSSKKKSSGGSSKKKKVKTPTGKKPKPFNMAGALDFDIKPNKLVKYNNYANAYANTMRKTNPSGGGTVTCPKCGNRVSSSNGKCPICGASL